MVNYEVGMYCKHFKGQNLIDKNIYKILSLGIEGKDINTDEIIYSGDNDLLTATNLVVYTNIFQENKIFAREYEALAKELSPEQKIEYKQNIRVQPLTLDEIDMILNPIFIENKLSSESAKQR